MQLRAVEVTKVAGDLLNQGGGARVAQPFPVVREKRGLVPRLRVLGKPLDVYLRDEVLVRPVSLAVTPGHDELAEVEVSEVEGRRIARP